MIAKRVKLKDTVYYQTFIGHIEDGLKILFAYLESKGHIIQNFCQRWEIDEEVFCKNLFLTVALHDIGKLTVQFQNNIKQGKRSSRHPHAFFGLPVLEKIPFDPIENLPLPLFAITGHHTQLYRKIYSSDRIAHRVSYHEDEILEFVNTTVEELYQRLNFSNYFRLPVLKLSDWKRMDKTAILDNFVLPYTRSSDIANLRVKSIFTYFFSILQLCDDYSSAHFHHFIEKNTPAKVEFDSVITNTEDIVYDLDYSLDEFKQRLFKDYTLYDFQDELFDKSAKFSFLFAPCGRGKTEAALWWAYQIKNQFSRDKIIFALPTQVTCNAMHARLVDDNDDSFGLGEKNVGLFHGKSLITLKYRLKDNSEFKYDEEAEEKEEIEYKSHDILRDEVFKGNVFFKPVTVTTIDHLAYAFVHGFSQADFTCGNLQNSVIIFDEVHYYEQHTLNILMRLFDILRGMEIPHLLMTGTAPQFLLKEIEKHYQIVTDEEGLAFQPFVIKKQEGQSILNEESVFESILNDYQSKKSIFVILNQVEWAQNFYSDLIEFFGFSEVEPKIILYHGRFIHKDRIQKEKEIRELVKQKPCIVVATQVIEISLDISSDVMYSTIAPPDAIGQRAGRLNRSGKFYKNGSVHELKLFNVEKHLPYSEDLIRDSWGSFKNGATTYRKIKEVCDLVYGNVKLKKDKRFKDFFKKNILFGDHHSEITYGDDEGRSLKIRDDNFQQIDVIPSRVFEEAEKRISDKKDFWVEYKVRIPLYKLKQDNGEHGRPFNFTHHMEHSILECDYEYDYTKGIQFDKTYKRVEIL